VKLISVDSACTPAHRLTIDHNACSNGARASFLGGRATHRRELSAGAVPFFPSLFLLLLLYLLGLLFRLPLAARPAPASSGQPSRKPWKVQRSDCDEVLDYFGAVVFKIVTSI
jgi:hypothetical protein